MCRQPATGAADLLPSGAFVTRKACVRCRRVHGRPGVTMQDIRARDTTPAGVPKDMRYVRCAGPCKRVMRVEQLNHIVRRGHADQHLCGECMVAAARTSAMN
jgi:hypothetical protein